MGQLISPKMNTISTREELYALLFDKAMRRTVYSLTGYLLDRHS